MNSRKIEKVLKGVRIKKCNAKRVDKLAELETRTIGATVDLMIEYYFDNNPTEQRI